MTSIICLTGVVGSGKSTIANRFSPSTLVISADEVQFDAVKRAFPFVRDSKELIWGVWSFDPWLLHLNELFNLSLISKYPKLHEHQGNIILEGCIVCNDWFRVPLLEEIMKTCQLDSSVAVHHLDLIPEAELLQEQILRRGNQGDLGPFAEMDFVVQHIEWAEQRTDDDDEKWVRFQDPAELETAIQAILNSTESTHPANDGSDSS